MVPKTLFNELDHLVGNDMMVLNLSLNDIVDFLESKNINLDTKVREPLPGEKLEDIDDIGAILIRMAATLKDFLSEYKEIKDTWQVVNA
jgi:hypothetical protein